MSDRMKKKIRVLAIVNLFPTEENPADTPANKDQIDALRKSGVDIDVLHIKREKKINYLLALWKVFLLNFKPHQYDLVHAYYGHCGLIALAQFRYPVIITYLGSDILHPKEKFFGKITAKLASRIIVMSEEMKQASGRQDAEVIPTGINTEIFKPEPRDQARQALNLPEDKKLVLFPWNPERPVKRFDIVSKTMDILKSHGSDVELVTIYQKPPDIVAQYMNASDVLILASDHEGSPLSVREAMACDLPIVSVDAGDVREVIAQVENCVIAAREPAEMASAIEEILETGKRSNGSSFIGKESALEAAKKVLDVYQIILK